MMVGRSKRLATKEVVEVVTDDDEDIICLDEPRKQRTKNRAVKNVKPEIPEKREQGKSPEKDVNGFDGIDIEGASEEEKRQIKEAMLASMRDQGGRGSSDTTVHNITVSSSLDTSTNCGTSEVNRERKEAESEVYETAPEETIVDEDETQPPSDSDIEEVQLELNLDQSTLEDSRDDIFETDSMTREDSDATLRDEDINNVEMEDVSNKRKRKKTVIRTSSPLPKQKSSGQKDRADHNPDIEVASKLGEEDDSSVQMVESGNETDNSQGFEPDLQFRAEKDQGNNLGQAQSSPSGGQSDLCRESEGSQKVGQSDSQEPCCSDTSNGPVTRTSQKSSSQKSQDSENDTSRSSGLQNKGGASDGPASRSSSQNNEIGLKHVPLKRHYRCVKKEFQNLRHDKYFCDTSDIEFSAKAIYQLFETYRRKLYEAQRKCRKKMTWPEPVKAGTHQSKSIDIKKRGEDSIYLNLSDEDDNPKQDRKVEIGRGRPRIVGNVDKESDSELPDLIIESEHDSRPYSTRRLTRRALHTKHVNNDIISADTQPYDFDNSDEDFVPNLPKSRSGSHPKVFDIKKDFVCENAKPTREGFRRKFGLRSEKSDPKVLAKETQQEDVDIREAIKRSMIDSQRTLPETQLEDGDFDWLNVKQQNGKEEFENQVHKAKLIGYSIPKRANAQMHSKSHQKVISSEQSKNDEQRVEMEEDSVETTEKIGKGQKKTESEEVEDNAPLLRGRKRKATKYLGATLVEETQDPEVEDVNKSNLRGKRKRNCFRIESDTEDESIAESQDVDEPAESSSNEKKLKSDNSGRSTENTSKSKSEGFFSSVVSKVKKFVTPTKARDDVEEIDEGSQSPVISKKRITSRSKNSSSKDDTQYDAEAFNEFKSASAEKNVKNVGTEEKMRRVQMTFDEKDLIENGNPKQVKRSGEKDGMSEGVKRFISRPSSKDSNASDNLSTTSSQMSNHIFDEKGDIYSTQYCEIRSRKGKGERFKDPRKQEKKKREEELQEVLMLDSDDEVPVVNEQKTFSVRKFVKKTQVVKGVKGIEKRDNQPVTKKECISQYFDKAPKEGDENVPIDLDQDINDPEHEQTEKGSGGKVLEHRDEAGSYKGKRGVSRNKETKVNVPVISILDEETEQKVEKVKFDTIQGSSKYEDAQPSNRNIQNRQKRVTRQHFNTETMHHLDTVSENPPVMLNNSSKPSVDSSNVLEQYLSGARPKTRHAETNTNLFDQKPKRQRKVSETISSAEYEARERGEQTRGKGTEGDQDVLGEEWGQVKGSLRKRPRQQNEASSPVTVKKKMELVACPLCNKEFPANIIEQHAAACLEPQEDEDTSVEISAEDYMQHLVDEHPHLTQEEVLQGLYHHHQHNQQHHHHHHGHMGGLQGHVGHLPDTADDVEIVHIVQNDVHVEDVAKTIRSSPGEEGELQQCYICDAQIPKGKPYDVHISRCLALAAQQQAEVDKKGFKGVFTEPEQEEVQMRTLRGRRINPGDRDSTPKAQRHRAENSPTGFRNRKLEPNSVSPTANIDGHEDERIIITGQLQYQEVQGNEEGAAKRVMRRVNRNNAALDCDGYKSDQVAVLDSEEESTNGSSWEDSSSTDSCDDDNITLASVVRSGSSALVTGPWNKSNSKSQNVNQSQVCNDVPDWVKVGVHSPIKTFVPISQQDDPEYFQKQFSYQRERVENRMNKRKRTKPGGQKRRRKRRKVRKTKGKS